MRKWEYLVVDNVSLMRSGSELLEKSGIKLKSGATAYNEARRQEAALNVLGSEGWELVKAGQMHTYLKREV